MWIIQFVSSLQVVLSRGVPYEDAFCRILYNSKESDKSLKHEIGITLNILSVTCVSVVLCYDLLLLSKT